MNPEKDQSVKILFKNGMYLDGIVESWTDTKAVLRSLDGNSLIIIQNTSEDIMAVKVYLKTSEKNIELKTNLEKEFQEVLDKPAEDINAKTKRLVDLRMMLSEQDKKIVANKLKEHHITEPNKVKYGYPRFFSKSSSK
jgi:sRNA-binding regulator protein Hfq